LPGTFSHPIASCPVALWARGVAARHKPESLESNQAQTLIEAAEKASHAVMPFPNVTGPTPEQS